MSGNIKGSAIWNKAWENKGLVQGNSFWEIREGDLALFWEEKWQREPKLLTEDFWNLKHETDTQGLTRVKYFQDDTHNNGKWRKWKNIECRNDGMLNTKVEALGKMLEQRMILVSEGQEQLRWGNNTKGIFNIKEAKSVLLELDSQAPKRNWLNIWRHKGWVKIKLFMWLVLQSKILTWDNIRKRGILDLPYASSMKPKRKLWNIFSTAVISLPDYGRLLPTSINNLIGTRRVLLTPLTDGGEIFWITKFSTLLGPSFKVLLFGTYGRKGIRESSKMKIIPLIICLIRS